MVESVVIIVGELAALGPLRRDLLGTYLRWEHDLAVSRTMGVGWPATA